MATLLPPEDVSLIVEDFADGRSLIPRITVDEYHDLMRTAGLDEESGWELLDGLIRRVDKGAASDPKNLMNPLHAYVVTMLVDLAPRFTAHGCHLRLEKPIILGERDEPQPDAAIVRGKPADFVLAHPSAKHVLCVVEVADSSLAADMTFKLRRYARARIATYVVIRLGHNTARVFTQPEGDGYAVIDECFASDTLALPTAAGPAVEVPLADLLAPPEA